MDIYCKIYRYRRDGFLRAWTPDWPTPDGTWQLVGCVPDEARTLEFARAVELAKSRKHPREVRP